MSDSPSFYLPDTPGTVQRQIAKERDQGSFHACINCEAERTARLRIEHRLERTLRNHYKHRSVWDAKYDDLKRRYLELGKLVETIRVTSQ